MKAAAIAALGLLIVLPAHAGNVIGQAIYRHLHATTMAAAQHLMQASRQFTAIEQIEKTTHPDCGEYRYQAGDHSAPC